MKSKNAAILEGLIKRHADGFGFFIPDNRDHPDVYIPRSSMKSCMTGDRVMVEALQDKNDQRYSGRILKIMERGTKVVLGKFLKINDHKGLIKDDGQGWGEDLRVNLSPQSSVKQGELVSIEIISYPGEDSGFLGKLKEVIGDANDPLIDSKKVLLNQQIPFTFPKAVEQEASKIKEVVAESDIKSRKDLRDLLFITIDGATAKDFDDAIYVELHDKGFKLFVAIADVSHYVKPNSPIDQEAYQRGTSVYFPNFVVPMLPEVLSNGLCSLNPHVPRLSLVAEMDFDFTGVMTQSRFYEATIESKARVTYGQAQDVIEGNENSDLEHVKKEILRAADLAKILMAKRFREGSLDLEIPEVQMVLDSTGVPSDFIRSERLFAHRLIEEMMLAANVAVAKFLTEKEVPAIYRIHDSPNADAIEILEGYLEKFGGSTPMAGKVKLQKKLTKALQQFEGKPESQILNILALRSMSQAKYSTQNIGHFGLGFEDYTHFTSPIRRYPDLIVHRLIKSVIMPKSKYKPIPEEELQTSASMLSACEQRAVKAERQFVSIKKARFMNSKIGQEFEGIISSVTKFGVFVLLRQFEVDGLIRLESLSKEPLIYDEERLVLFGKRSGMTYSVGDQVMIEVADVDIDQGQVDFELVEVLHSQSEGHLETFGSSARSSSGEKHKKGKFQKNKSRFERENRPEKSTKKSSHSSASSDSPKNFFSKFLERTKETNSKKDFGTGKKSEKKSGKAKSRFFGDHKNESKNEPLKEDNSSNSSKNDRQSLSRKMKAIDKIETDNDSKLLNYLDKKAEESKSTGEKFDPAKHFETVLAKWKSRNQGNNKVTLSQKSISLKSKSYHQSPDAEIQIKKSNKENSDKDDFSRNRKNRSSFNKDHSNNGKPSDSKKSKGRKR